MLSIKILNAEYSKCIVMLSVVDPRTNLHLKTLLYWEEKITKNRSENFLKCRPNAGWLYSRSSNVPDLNIINIFFLHLRWEKNKLECLSVTPFLSCLLFWVKLEVISDTFYMFSWARLWVYSKILHHLEKNFPRTKYQAYYWTTVRGKENMFCNTTWRYDG